jgi:hypothetical protein
VSVQRAVGGDAVVAVGELGDGRGVIQSGGRDTALRGGRAAYPAPRGGRCRVTVAVLLRVALTAAFVTGTTITTADAAAVLLVVMGGLRGQGHGGCGRATSSGRCERLWRSRDCTIDGDRLGRGRGRDRGRGGGGGGTSTVITAVRLRRGLF